MRQHARGIDNNENSDVSSRHSPLATRGYPNSVFEIGDTANVSADICCTLPPSLRLTTAEAAQIAAMFKALSHPVRLQMVDLLSRFGGQVCVCDIESQFELSQPTISHHLKILREAGLIASEQRGLWVYYVTCPAALSFLGNLLGSLASRQHACGTDNNENSGVSSRHSPLATRYVPNSGG